MSSLKEGDLSVVASMKEATRLFLKFWGLGEDSRSGFWRLVDKGEDEDSIFDMFEKYPVEKDSNSEYTELKEKTVLKNMWCRARLWHEIWQEGVCKEGYIYISVI